MNFSHQLVVLKRQIVENCLAKDKIERQDKVLIGGPMLLFDILNITFMI